MKQLVVLIVLIVIFGCQDRDRPEPEQETQLLSFTVSGLTHNVDEIASAKGSAQSLAVTNLNGKISQLVFVVYDSNGNELKRVFQHSTNEDFGRWTVELPVSDIPYKLAVVGSKQVFNLNSYKDPVSSPEVAQTYSSARMMYYQPNLEIVNELQYKTDDTFYAEFDFINRSPDPDEFIVTLQRIVGKLELDIKDSEQYSVQILNEATEFTFSGQKSENEIDDDTGHNRVMYDGVPLSFFILRTDRPLLIDIRYPVGSSWGHREVLVPIYKNKRTVVSGNLYQAAQEMAVSVNDVWDEDAPPVTF